MLISAKDCRPKLCTDCNKALGKMNYGKVFEQGTYKTTSPAFIRADNFWIECGCGAVFVWSFDETGRNGGIWKRRHVLPLFDTMMRIELTDMQIKRFGRTGK